VLNASILTFGSRVFTAIAKVIATILVVRGFGPTGQGAFSVALNISVIAGLAGSAGLEIANAYDVGRRPELGRSIILQSLAVAALAGGAIGAALWAFFPSVPLLAGLDPGYRTLLFLAPPAAVSMSLLSGLAVGASAFALLAAANILVYGVLILGAVGGILLGHPLLAFAGWLVGNLAASSVIGVALWNRLPGVVGFRNTGLLARARFSGAVYFANLLNWLNFRVDLLIVAALLGTGAAGAYAVAATLAEGLLYLGKSVAQPILASAARGMHVWDREALRPYRLVVFATAAGSVALIITAPLLVTLLYGVAVLAAVPPLMVLAAAMPAVAFTTLATSHLFGMGIARPTVVAVGVATGISVILDFIFVPGSGIIAAAIASLIAYSVAALLLAGQLRHRIEPPSRWRDFLLMAGDDVAAVRQSLRQIGQQARAA
jgi:O-antigen/teichoic acid export membrane protein